MPMNSSRFPTGRFALFAAAVSLLTFFALGTYRASAALQLSEFMASNDSTLADEDGEFTDWIEIRNPDASAVSLAGYYLTDNATNLTSGPSRR